MNPQPRHRPQHSLKTARKVTRLEGFDYSSEGAYFVTLVTKDRQHLFGEIVDEEMVLNDFGRIVLEEWERSTSIRKEIELGEFVIMPNHFHGIVHIFNDLQGKGDLSNSTPSNVGAYGHTPQRVTGAFRSPSRSLGAMVRGFKSAVTTRINILRHTPGNPVWQRNYHDHIVGTDREYEQIEEYILDNPLSTGRKDREWAWDEENKP